MKSLHQDIKISLVESPAGVTNVNPFDCSNYFTFDCPAPTSLDYPEESGAETEVGYAPCCSRPIRKVGDLLKFTNFFL